MQEGEHGLYSQLHAISVSQISHRSAEPRSEPFVKQARLYMERGDVDPMDSLPHFCELAFL